MSSFKCSQPGRGGVWQWGSAQLGVKRCYLPGAGRWAGSACARPAETFVLLPVPGSCGCAAAVIPAPESFPHERSSGRGSGCCAQRSEGLARSKRAWGASGPDGIGGSLPEETGGLGLGLV